MITVGKMLEILNDERYSPNDEIQVVLEGENNLREITHVLSMLDGEKETLGVCIEVEG